MRTGQLVVVSLLLLGTFGRGLWELGLPKPLAFVAQALLFAAGVAVAITTPVGRWSTRGQRVVVPSVLLLLSFAVVALTSGLVTLMWYHPTAQPVLYLMVSFFAMGWWFVACSLPLPRRLGNLPIGDGLFIMALIALLLTALELLGIWHAPGTQELRYLGLVRPAGITGAMQHHAILMAALFFVLWEIGRRRNHWSFRAVALACAAASVTSLTRSGAMILVVGLLLVLAHAGARMFRTAGIGRVRRDVPFLLVLAVVATLVWNGLVRDQPVPITAHVGRILSALDLASAGNDQRLESWRRGIREIADGPLVLGHQTGMVTNVVSRLAGGSSYVVESGPLQQILNYGILGCLLFYAMLMQVVKTVPTRYIWLKAAAASLVLNSLVYQSIEVFPVIVLLGLLPWLADMLDARPRVSAATPQPLPIHP